MLAERLPAMPLVVLMRGLMASLLDVLEGRRDQAITVMQKMDCAREPEVMFYIARHFAMIDAPAEAVRMVRQARESGFWSSVALTRDAVFEPLRRRADFKREVSGASRAEDESRLSLRRAGLALPSA